ncbi:Uncharacterised protein [Metamycoplasma arthritidis]|uniref:Hypothetical lipoprotein n=1 Tax=Metamycoplasma arthritidis (strain 158L3-1) TaxID=243272 RepID=B3PLW9_META1|nr:variable surface lipoprotein [Metamycoplasma arthritidis]ACF07021.1 hypothetical lipoprotein [Metamycoplasma arthritidis 158L3-1]VEU78549.1 Uncharacterised protein [Metamycoplasma arthritidis]
MKKNKILLSLITISSLTIPLVTLSCSKNESYLDINKISRRYLTRLSGSQIATLHNYQKIFYFYKSGKKTYYDYAKFNGKELELYYEGNIAKYSFDFKTKSNWEQFINSVSDFAVRDSQKDIDINELIKEYNFDDVDLSNGYSDIWFNTLTQKNGHDYHRVGNDDEPYFPDLQSLIFRAVRDSETNFSLLNKRAMVNKNNKNIIANNHFKNEYIQGSSWLKKDDQIKLFEYFLMLYISKFTKSVKEIKINWKAATVRQSYSGQSEYVEFTIEDIIDFQNKSLLKPENKNKKFYINNFRTYKTNQKFGVGNEGLKEELPLFNEYIQNPLLRINGGQYLNIVDNINHFIKGATSFEFWNAKGLMYLFQNFKDEMLSVDIPEDKKQEDAQYKIIDFKYTNYLKTNQLFKAIVRVFKKDGTYKDYVWISSNFDDHGHRLKGLILSNKYEDELKPSDFYNFNENLNPIPKGISLEEFLKASDKYPSTPFEKLLERAGANLEQAYSYWNNDIRANYEANFIRDDSFQIKLLASFLNNYLLSYALENEAGKINSGVKRIDVKVLPTPYEVGRVKLQLSFMSYANENDVDFKSPGEKVLKTITLYWNGFKGYDNSLGNNAFTVIEK